MRYWKHGITLIALTDIIYHAVGISRMLCYNVLVITIRYIFCGIRDRRYEITVIDAKGLVLRVVGIIIGLEPRLC